MQDNKGQKRTIKRIGQISVEGSQLGVVFKPDGLMTTLCAGTHGYSMGYVLRKYEKANNSSGRNR